MSRYKYLGATNANLNVITKDSKQNDVITVNLDDSGNVIYTESLGTYTGKDAHHRIVAVDSITGTGNLTLQTSYDDINWFNTEDSSSNNIVISISSSFEYYDYQDINAYGNYQRWVSAGTMTGNVRIITTVK